MELQAQLLVADQCFPLHESARQIARSRSNISEVSKAALMSALMTCKLMVDFGLLFLNRSCWFIGEEEDEPSRQVRLTAWS